MTRGGTEPVCPMKDQPGICANAEKNYQTFRKRMLGKKNVRMKNKPKRKRKEIILSDLNNAQ